MSDQRHRARLLDVMPDAVFINTGGLVVSCNPAMVQLLGATSADEVLGRPVLSLFHPRYHDVIRRRVDLMLQTGASVPMIEEELVHLRDGLIPVEVIAASCVHDDQPSVVVVLRDLRRRQDLEARFRLLLGSVTDYAIFTTDADGRITSWNDGAARLSGFTAAEAMGQPHSLLFTAEDVAARAPERALEAALAAEQSVEAWRARKDGSRFWANTVITARRDGAGRPLGFVQVMRDLSERQASTAALVLSEGRHRELFDCISDPLFLYDRETLGYLAVNDAAVEQYGYSRAEFLAMTIKDIRPVEDVPALLQMLSRSTRRRESRGLWRHQKKSGAILHVEISARSLEFGGRPACLIHARDVTARLDAEQTTAEAMTALQQSQHLARIAGAVAKLGGWVVDVVANTVTWSDEVCLLHDRPPGHQPGIEEAVGYYAPEHRATIVSALAACAQTGARFDLELELVSAMNRRFWVRAIGEAFRDGAGHIVKVQGAFQDITTIRQTVDAVRLSEERFRLLAKTTHDAVWDWDMVSGSHWWNEGIETLFGYRRDELPPTIQFGLDCIHPDDVEATKAVVNRAVESGAVSWTCEYRFRHHSGEYVWVLDSGYILRDASGTPVRMIGGMKDLTERRRHEERIAEQAALLDEARDAIIVRDLDLRVSYWNKSAERLYGFDPQRVSGHFRVENLYVDQGLVQTAHRTTLETGGWRGELQVNGPSGTTMLVSSQWSLVRDRSGTPRALLIISTDITEKKALEAQFIRAQRMESIGTLAGGIAHDLNNVLAPILASIDFLRLQVGDNEDAIDALGTLDICARRGADLVKQVLSFARGVEGQRMSVNLAHLVYELVHVLEDTLPKSIAVKFTPERELWAVTGDSTQLHQVLLNLCVNARDAMPAGGTLDVQLKNIVLDETYASMNVDARPGPYVMVQVKDTGTGMSPAVQERIFDPFFTTKEIGKGTGLGLSTTLTIIKSHGGFINVYSELGKGTKFKVFVPANASSEVAAEVTVRQSGLPRGKGETVLVVDDEEAIRKVVRGILERYGYSVLLASHGAEAVALYAQHRERIALVLTDMAMPVMDGPATIIAIKSMNAQTRFVGSSGLTANGDTAKAVGAGVRYFVGKPYTAEALLKTVRDALDEPVGD